MAAEMVGSALVQEVVSGASSYISGKLEERASRAHLLARLEMALSQLEFALERAGKLPITYVSLLRRMKMLRCAYHQGTDLLNKHKKMVERDQDLVQQQPVTRPIHEGIFRRAARSLSLPAFSAIVGLRNKEGEECLSSSVVQRFEWYASCADKFVTDVESGCPFQRGDHTFRYPLLRHLLEGKTLHYDTTTTTGSRRQQQVPQQRLCTWPVRLEERGVEAWMMYQYLDKERLEKRFRLSDDTDIVGIAIKCLRSLTSLFKPVTASDAAEELTLLHQLQDIVHSYGPPLDWTEEKYIGVTKSSRPDPVCCTDISDSVVSSYGVPEPVIAVGFGCYVSGLSALECNSGLVLAPSGGASSSSAGDAAADADARNASPPFYMVAGLVPHDHHMCGGVTVPGRGIVLSFEAKEGCLGGDSIKQVEVPKWKPVNCVFGRSEPADYDVSYYAPPGIARLKLRKASDELEWMTETKGGHRAFKRKR